MYKKTTLKNGMRIISEKMDYLRSVSLGIWVNMGSRDESISENGISHFIEHMIFKGTENRNSMQIAKELDSLGGFSNAFTGKENTCFYTRVLGKHFIKVVDVFSDIVLNSLFDPSDIERERQVILQEISMVEDTPEDNIHVLFNRFFWDKHPIGRSILGTDETVSEIKKETILNNIDKFYVPEQILVVAAGDVDHDIMVACFEPFFGELDGGNSIQERISPFSNEGVSVHYKDLEQVHICLGGEAPSHENDKRFACAVFNTILGGNMSSRLFQEIREKRGLAYSIYSFGSSYVDSGMLGIYVATDLVTVNPVLSTIHTEIDRFIRGEVSDLDLEAAKEHLIGNLYLSSESSDSRMTHIARNEFIFGRYIDREELVSELDKVNVDEVVKIAGDIFRDSKVGLVTLGPLKEEDLDKSCLQFN